MWNTYTTEQHSAMKRWRHAPRSTGWTYRWPHCVGSDTERQTRHCWYVESKTYTHELTSKADSQRKKTNLWLPKGKGKRSCSVQLSRSVVSNPLWPNGLQHTRPPVHHQLLEVAQTHVHRVSDAIKPSHPLSPTSPAFNLSQHQGLFQPISSLHQVAEVLELQLQHQSFQWTFRVDFL